MNATEPISVVRRATRDEDLRWDRVRARDARAREEFVFGVRTTRIYCRPGCAARLPRRENVRFFDGPDAAERAGFRPCLRCRPREAAVPSAATELVARACRHIESDLEGPLSLPALARELGVGVDRLRREFRRVTGLTPRQYSDAQRMGRFKRGVRESGSVVAALYDAGYGSSSRLYERSGAQLGMTPATYGHGGRGARIGYVLVDSPLGRLLVAATGRGVCGVSLGHGDAALRRFVREEFPEAEIREGGSRMGRWVREIVNRLRGRAPRMELPLDVRATAFQWRVWRELAAIPRGITRSYGEVARRIGRPRAARAVGRACASNPVAVAIPCHRVVRGDGQPGGYRWGAATKRELLRREK